MPLVNEAFKLLRLWDRYHFRRYVTRPRWSACFHEFSALHYYFSGQVYKLAGLILLLSIFFFLSLFNKHDTPFTPRTLIHFSSLINLFDLLMPKLMHIQKVNNTDYFTCIRHTCTFILSTFLIFVSNTNVTAQRRF